MLAFQWRNAVAAGLMMAAASVPSLAIADDNDNDFWARWGMGQMMMGGWGMSGPIGGGPSGAMLDRVDGRLAFLKTELKITEQQAVAWTEFADVILSLIHI